jgi:hypothetical protein
MRGWLFGNKDVGEGRSERPGPPPDSESGINSTVASTAGQDGIYLGPGIERGGRPGIQTGRTGQS